MPFKLIHLFKSYSHGMSKPHVFISMLLIDFVQWFTLCAHDYSNRHLDSIQFSSTLFQPVRKCKEFTVITRHIKATIIDGWGMIIGGSYWKLVGCASKHIPRFPKHIPWFVFKANENTIFENLKLVHTLCLWEIRAGLHVPLTMPMYCLGERWIRLSSPVHNACVFLRRVQTGIRHPFIILIRENQIWPSSAIYNVVALLSFSVTLGGTIRKFVFQVDFW